MDKLRKLVKILLDRKFRQALFRTGVAASTEHESLFFKVTPSIVVDIGANRGQFALAARRALPAARIYSFEPLKKAACGYRRVFKDDLHVDLYEVAIGPARYLTNIHLSARDDSSSLLPIGPEQSRLFPGTHEVATQTIQVASLSDYLNKEVLAKSALLKLDVQGFELSALQGCESLLGCFQHIYVECSFVELYEGQALVSDIIEWLLVRGFILIGVFNVTYDRRGQAIQGDFLFSTKGTAGS